ncbi:hypothetical protein NQZ68_028168 [Dissostichus eleginoides]|nr:hypothetical protein NQZ68_028168 [Dissostichus eleginoides]
MEGGDCGAAILVQDTAVLVRVVKSSSRALPRAKRGSHRLRSKREGLPRLSVFRWSLSSAEATRRSGSKDETPDDYTSTTCYGGASA